MSELPSVTFKAIGIVRNEIKHPPGGGYHWDNIISEIEIDKSLTEYLEGLEQFSHIILIYWTHQTSSRGEPQGG